MASNQSGLISGIVDALFSSSFQTSCLELDAVQVPQTLDTSVLAKLKQMKNCVPKKQIIINQKELFQKNKLSTQLISY